MKKILSFALGLWGELWTMEMPILLVVTVAMIGVAGIGVEAVVAHRAGVDRDVTTAWADQACELVGGAYTPAPVKGHRSPRREKWGEHCLDLIRHLVDQRAQVREATSQVLAAHVESETKKTAVDRTVARRHADRRRAAEDQMEKANAALKGDHVDGGWFARLDALAGLRDPVEGADGRPAPAGGGGSPQAEPPV